MCIIAILLIYIPLFALAESTQLHFDSFTGVSIAEDFLAIPGGSSSSFGSRVRMLEFNVQHGDRIVHLKVSFSSRRPYLAWFASNLDSKS